MTSKPPIAELAFKTFVESAPVLCLAADTDFITHYVNPFYLEVHNISIAEACGKHIQEIIGEEGFSDNLPFYEQTLRGNIVEHNGSFTKLNGSIHHYKATYAPIYDDANNIVGFTGVVLDITSEVEVECANQKLMKLNADFEKAQQELTRQASLDPLTELYNRRYFSEISESIFNIAVRKRLQLSVVLLDIDNFKAVNDTYGHKVGDRVLVHLAQILKTNVRRSDVVCRYGGEEFIVLLPETGIADASHVAENLRVLISSSEVAISDEHSIQFSVSLGVAAAQFCDSHRPCQNIEQVISRADKALYKAKAQGKNCVVAQN